MKQNALSTLAKHLVIVASLKALIVYGDWSRRDGIPGHASSPLKGFKKALWKRATVIDQDEYRTSKLCSDCHQTLQQASYFFKDADNKIVLKINRVVLRSSTIDCKASFWNRGVNAALNILNLVNARLPTHLQEAARSSVNLSIRVCAQRKKVADDKKSNTHEPPHLLPLYTFTSDEQTNRPMKLRVLTYNVFFEPVFMELRMKAIGRVIERARPAIVGFQEVTRDSLAMLKKQASSQHANRHFLILMRIEAPPFSEAYFVVLFSALPVLALETLPFANSGMGRELVAMQVEVAPGKSLFVGTSHLESMPQFSRTRVAQLKEAMHFLEERVETSNTKTNRTCLGAIFMGDTNLMRADMKMLDSRFGSAIADLEVENAKSARSKCRTCGEIIAKDATRVGKMAKDTLPGGKTLEIRLWYHENCFLGMATPEEKQVMQILGASNGSIGLSAPAATEANKIDLATLGLPSGWKDLWLSMDGNTEENGCTFDGKTNALVASKAFQSRLDRMYFYAGGPAPLREAFAESSASVLEKMEIVGKEPIGDGLWPSDHFGLLASFKFDEDSEESSTESSSQEVKATSQSPATGSPLRKKMREAAEARAAAAGKSVSTAVEIE